MHREFRKPLVIMTPKSLLRHKRCFQIFQNFQKSTFLRVLEDDAYSNIKNLLELKKEMKKLKKLLCVLEKFIMTLLKHGKNIKIIMSFIRIEQLYRFR